jgi:hypothetical protein
MASLPKYAPQNKTPPIKNSGGEKKRVAKRRAGLQESQSLSSQFQLRITSSPFSMRYGTLRLSLLFRTYVQNAFCATAHRILSGLNLIRHRNALALYTKYLYFFKHFIYHSARNLGRGHSQYTNTGFGSEKP